MEIARNTTKTIEISIDSSRILLDLGDGESVETDEMCIRDRWYTR